LPQILYHSYRKFAKNIRNNTPRVLNDAVAACGNMDEADFFGAYGGYRISCTPKGQPCPKYGQPIQAKNLLGSAAIIV
jgi:hypothetical protein